MLRAGLIAALCGLVLFPAGAAAQRRVLLVFVPPEPVARVTDSTAPPDVYDRSAEDRLLRDLDRRPGLALGVYGATQGEFSPEQTLLDISAGTRVSPAAYEPKAPDRLRFVPRGSTGVIAGWSAALRRADTAPANIRPGLLGQSVPGGAAYVGVDGVGGLDAAAAADRNGRVPAVSLGPAATLLQRVEEAGRTRRFVVVGLPPGPGGQAGLDALVARRAPDHLILAMERPLGGEDPQLMPVGMAGPDTEDRGLTSNTTRRPGVVTSIDVLPTVLRWLQVGVPSGVRGSRIRTTDRLSVGELLALRDRWARIAPRRIPVLAAVVFLWFGLILFLGLWGLRRTLPAALRIGALAFLWLPPVLLLCAAIAPSRVVAELGIMAAACFAVAAITDRLLPWPRGPAAPAAVGLVAITVDLGFGSDLISQSLIGPNPRFGARYYGIGNELEALLPAVLFIGLAAAMTGGARSKRRAAAFALSGLALGIVIGWGRLGADVGGVITVSAGTAVATLLMLPGGVTRRAIALAALVPVAAVAALALLDLVTGVNSHFTRTVLQNEGASNLWDIVSRRYESAFASLVRGLMPLVTAIALLAVACAYRNRDWLYRTAGRDPAWRAALAGTVTAGIVGSLFNDSGPVLLVVSIFALGVATAYIQGDPRLAAAGGSSGDGVASGAGEGPGPQPSDPGGVGPSSPAQSPASPSRPPANVP